MGRFISHYDEKLGLTVWTVSSTGIGDYYYKCPQAPSGFGPFMNQQDAIKHYNSVIKSVVVMPPVLCEPPKNNVISVDFRTKRRIG